MREHRTCLPSPPLLFIAFSTPHRSPLSERLEQATLGHWDACVGTCDSETSSMGRGDVWDGDVGRQIQGRRGRGDVNEYCKSRR